MASTTAVRNAMALAWSAQGDTYSLHTGDPGPDGLANEATGPDYQRLATIWGTPVDGTILGSQLVFLVDEGDYTHMCRWNGTTLVTTLDTTDAIISPAGEVKVTPNYTYTGD